MPITREQWESMSDKAHWDVKVSLRGPDSYYGETLKWFTTSVIRGQMKDVFRVGGTVNSDLKLIILPKSDHYDKPISEDLGRFAWNADHFIEHVRQAADWIGIPVLKIPKELWNVTMCYPNQRQSCLEILTVMKPLKKMPSEGIPLEFPNSPKGNLKDSEDTKQQTPQPRGSAAMIAELERHYLNFLGGKYYAKSKV